MEFSRHLHQTCEETVFEAEGESENFLGSVHSHYSSSSSIDAWLEEQPLIQLQSPFQLIHNRFQRSPTRSDGIDSCSSGRSSDIGIQGITQQYYTLFIF